jgi:signal transduction histidine kinase
MSGAPSGKDAPVRRIWALALALAILVPIGIWMSLVYAHQKSLVNDHARMEVEHRTELLRAQLQSPYEPGSLLPAGSDGDGSLLGRAATRVTNLSNLGPDYKVLLFEPGLEKTLAVRGLQPDQALPFVELARAAGVPAALDVRQAAVQGAPHLVSIAPLWKDGPVLVVARDLGVAQINAGAEEMASHGIAVLVFSTIALAVLLWLFVGRPGRPSAGAPGPGKSLENQIAAPAPNDREELELANAIGAVSKMATALDGAEAARGSERRDRDMLEGKLRRWQVGAAVRQLTDAMADEIGSPLNTILGRARLAAASPNCPPDTRAALETIALQAERITRVVAEMLRVTRPTRMRSGVCDLAAIAEQVLGAIGPECQRAKVPVMLEREADSAYVKVDEERAFQIVVNACLSAVEAQPEGGNVTLRIRAEGRESSPGRRVLLEVEDQGRPPADEVDTTGMSGLSSAIDARGFGLMIARGLVVEAGGLFELRAGARGGAVYQFTFPGGRVSTPPSAQTFTRSSMERLS